MHRHAPNSTDQVKIKERVLAGQEPESIARALHLDLGPVTNWCEHWLAEDKKEKAEQAKIQAAADERAKEAAAEQRAQMKAELMAELEAEGKLKPTPNPNAKVNK